MKPFILLLWAFATPVFAQTDWPNIGADKGGNRYSNLKQINRENVKKLKVAWTYRTGDAEYEKKTPLECTPIVVNGVMYLTTVKSKVIALDAATGRELWKYDPFLEYSPAKIYHAGGGVNRGVAYWQGGTTRPVARASASLTGEKALGPARILLASYDGRLISLDARTGKPDPAFGRNGSVDLRQGMDRDLSELTYGATAPPGIFEDIVIVGASVGEGPAPSAPGDVRAFDVRTGRELWRFHTVPRPGEFGNDTWAEDSWRNRGGANPWSGVSVDAKRGLAFVATGSAAFDFYGGDRIGDNLFANCVIALDARTGKRRWHFQTVKHDIWDYDNPTPPILATVKQNGKSIDAVAQLTKTGCIFLLDRETGKPLFDIEYRPVPASEIPGEKTAATQPFPTRPTGIVPQNFTEEMVTDISKEAHDDVLARLRKLRHGTIFTPQSLEGTVILPGLFGGFSWAGGAFDPETGILYANTNNIPRLMNLKAVHDQNGPYRISGYDRFSDPEGYPAVKPPWGMINAIDLNKGEILWKKPLGEIPELIKRGLPPTGTENLGGAVVTAGGLVFLGATKDEKFRAIDKTDGKLLWETVLPAAGYATPSVYLAGGKQFVVIAAGGGGKLGTKVSDAFVAFALP
jgi:quinoprotein glucose dehydrogenase